jgi:hypothetical protein
MSELNDSLHFSGGEKMLTPDEFDSWCSRQNLSPMARKTLADIRSKEPARRVGVNRRFMQ